MLYKDLFSESILNGDDVHFNNNIDTPKEHYNNFTLNQKPYFYITSLSKLTDEKFTSLPKLFVDEIIKKRMNSHIKVMAQLSKDVNWNKYNQKMKPMYIERE